MNAHDDDSFEGAATDLSSLRGTWAPEGVGIGLGVPRTIPRFHFYSVAPPELFHRFSRQREAFAFFDALPGQDRRNIKLFQCELPHTGKREFVVCSARKYYEIYHAIGAVDKAKRHHYEIIRDGFPCRAYFDLEFAKAANPHVDGEALTVRWLQCVAWKVHAVFGLALDRESFVVLDSSTKDKFSKHVTVRIPAGGKAPSVASVAAQGRGQGCDSHYSAEDVEQGLVKAKECLFLNNLVLGLFVEALVSDMLRLPTAAIASASAPGFVGDSCTGAVDRREKSANEAVGFPIGTPYPKKDFADFWVYKKDGHTKTCFVDLGVYTRNRLFRLYGSCKYGKAKGLMLAMQDKQLYWSNADTGTGVDASTSADTSASSISIGGGGGAAVAMKQRKLIAEGILQASFVVPMDLFLHAPLRQDKAELVPRTMMTPQGGQKNSLPISVSMNMNGSDKKGTAAEVASSQHAPSTTSFTSTGPELKGKRENMTLRKLTDGAEARDRDSDDELNRAVYDIDVPIEFITTGEGNSTSAIAPTDSNAFPPAKKQKTVHRTPSHPLEAEPMETIHPLTFNVEYQALSLHSSACGIVGSIGSFPHNNAIFLERQAHMGEAREKDNNSLGNCEDTSSCDTHSKTNHNHNQNAIDYCGVMSLCLQVVNPAHRIGSSTRQAGSTGRVAGLSNGTLHSANDRHGLVGTSGGLVTGAGRVLGIANSVASKDWADRELAQSGKHRQESPFPAVDAFVLAFVNQRRDSQGTSSRGGYFSSWKVYGAASVYLPEGSGPAIKIRYQISGNRWCANLGRQHKSNQIILECDLHAARFHMIQSCWDPECRGFKSAPIDIPPQCKTDAVVSRVKELQELFIDRCVLAIDEDY